MNQHLKTIQQKLMNNETLVAVSKKRSMDEIMLLYKEGIRDFGENKAQELLEKISLPNDIRWHFIGHLQSNKVKQILPYTYLIHSVDSLSLAYTIEKEATKLNKTMPILIEINLSQEPQKYGFLLHEVEEVLLALNEMSHIIVSGIMVMGPNTNDVKTIENCFKQAQQLYNHLQISYPSVKILSMGMSQDYQIALAYGSNCLRIGTYLFTD